MEIMRNLERPHNTGGRKLCAACFGGRQHVAAVGSQAAATPPAGLAAGGRHGADVPVPELLRFLSADCPRRQAMKRGFIADMYGIHCPQLSSLRACTQIKPLL